MSEKSKNTVLYILLFLGFVIIVREYIGGRSLWVDEAMLALNMNRSFSELLKPLYYNQTSPILFLFAARFFTLIFGISDYSEILSNVVDEKFYIPSKKSLCSHLLCQFSINKFLIFKYK